MFISTLRGRSLCCGRNYNSACSMILVGVVPTSKIVEKAVWWSVFLTKQHCILNADSIKLTPPVLLFIVFLPAGCYWALLALLLFLASLNDRIRPRKDWWPYMHIHCSVIVVRTTQKWGLNTWLNESFWSYSCSAIQQSSKALPRRI